jgi:hypothetical protein
MFSSLYSSRPRVGDSSVCAEMFDTAVLALLYGQRSPR